MGNKLLELELTVVLFVLIGTIMTVGYSFTGSPDMMLTWNTGGDWMSSMLTANDGRIWVFWHSYRTGNDEIFYKIYNSSQVHQWSPDTQLTNLSSVDATPYAIQASDGKIWVVWMSNRTGNYDIFYKFYDGLSWSPDTRLTNDTARDELPSIVQTLDGKIWVFWDSKRTGNYDIFYKTTLDNGATWSSDVQLTTNKQDDWDPAVTRTIDGKIWLVWTRSPADDLFYIVYDGIWSSETRLTTGSMDDWHPSIVQTVDQKIWVVWDYGSWSAQHDILYKIYDGTSWSADTQLTTDINEDMMPSITQDKEGAIWVAWTSDRSGSANLYYRTTSIPQAHDVEIFSVIPLQTIAYPGQSVSIEVVARNHGTNPETMEVECYANSTLIGTQTTSVNPGQLKPLYFTWDTTYSSYGQYTINASAIPVLGETNIADNNLSDSIVIIDPWPNIAVTNVAPFKSVIGKGLTLNIAVTVENKAKHTENVNLTLYYDEIPIQSQKFTLEGGRSAIILFIWNTSYVPMGNHYIQANATQVLNEIDTTDNTYIDGGVIVTIPGDVNGDIRVNVLDLTSISDAFGSHQGSSKWDPNTDVNGNLFIDVLDLAIIGKNYGKTNP